LDFPVVLLLFGFFLLLLARAILPKKKRAATQEFVSQVHGEEEQYLVLSLHDLWGCRLLPSMQGQEG
jgi:hypothetical protein